MLKIVATRIKNSTRFHYIIELVSRGMYWVSLVYGTDRRNIFLICFHAVI